MASYPSPPSYMTPEWAQFLEADIVRAPTSASSSQNPPVHPCSRCPPPKLTVNIAPARRCSSQDRNGQVDGTELQNMLAAGGLMFSLQTVMQIIRLHNSRDSGTLDFAEFKQVQQFLSNVQASFQYFNQSKSGRLDKSEVLRALNHAGFGHVDEGAVKAACQAFDPDRTNSLSLDQYISMTLFLLNSKRVFEAFDATTPENGLIKLDFNQFVYAAAKTR